MSLDNTLLRIMSIEIMESSLDMSIGYLDNSGVFGTPESIKSLILGLNLIGYSLIPPDETISNIVSVQSNHLMDVMVLLFLLLFGFHFTSGLDVKKIAIQMRINVSMQSLLNHLISDQPSAQFQM